MEAIFEAIAADKTLQALTIVITLGSFIIFVLKLIIPIARFIKNLFKSGYKKAVVRLFRPIIQTVRHDIHDPRLIMATSYLYAVQTAIAISVPIMAFITIELVSRDLSRYGVLEKGAAESPPELWMWLVSIPISFTLTYIFLYPGIRLYFYLQILRRKLYREMRLRKVQE